MQTAQAVSDTYLPVSVRQFRECKAVTEPVVNDAIPRARRGGSGWHLPDRYTPLELPE